MGDETARRDFPDQAQRNAVCFRQWDDEHPEAPHPKPKETAFLPDTARCWSNHLGLWSIEATWFGLAMTAFKEGLWPFQRPQMLLPQASAHVDVAAAERRLYPVTDEGVGIIELMGPLTKGGSLKFDGTSTVRTQRALRMAARDETVRRGLLHIDSPGGHVAGIEALAAEVVQFRRHKPLIAHISDLGASAAYWVSSQADAIYANATSEIGGLGTIAVVEDTSNRMDRLGIKVHVISTGPYKGVGVEGVPISETALAYLKERVEAINGHFMQAVQGGRRFTPEHLATIADGRVFIAERAHALGLIDGVQSFDTTLSHLSTSPGSPGISRPRMAHHRARFAAWDVTHKGGSDAHRHV